MPTRPTSPAYVMPDAQTCTLTEVGVKHATLKGSDQVLWVLRAPPCTPWFTLCVDT